ncbi:hypothetical protein Pmani_016109 [Petrolisthes manimaculis]|uniref:Uncharacterized protein n=1 Tax=Petrolisthes manimaculis TaxID=1843537 RepID=A0AAE1PT34_9EUCA|nr:hypothetical protein Pmani_016109 [Petrolisthes manimaculis]
MYPPDKGELMSWVQHCRPHSPGSCLTSSLTSPQSDLPLSCLLAFPSPLLASLSLLSASALPSTLCYFFPFSTSLSITSLTLSHDPPLVSHLPFWLPKETP